jgi:hypothetical protein
MPMTLVSIQIGKYLPWCICCKSLCAHPSNNDEPDNKDEGQSEDGLDDTPIVEAAPQEEEQNQCRRDRHECETHPDGTIINWT